MPLYFYMRLLAGACLGATLMTTGSPLVLAQRDPNLDKRSSSPLSEQEALKAQASAEKQFGNLIYTPPIGWKQEGNDSVRAYVAPDLKPGENCRILVLPGGTADGDFAGSFERVMGQVRSSLKAKLLSTGSLGQRKGPQGSDNMTRTDVIELPSGARWTCYLGLLRAGASQETIVSFASSAELYNRYLPVLNHFMGALRFANLEQEAAHQEATKVRVLADGDPPFTQETADRFHLFFEWLLDAPMTQEQRDTLTQAIIAGWKNGKQSEKDFVMQVVRNQEQIEQKSLAERDVMRGKLQPVLLDALRKQSDDATSGWILSLYQNAHKVIASGAVPLTRQAADAYIELLDFLHNQAVGGEPFIALQKDKDAFAGQLAAAYVKFSPELQKHVADAPLLWAAVRYRWTRISDSERAEEKTKFLSYLQNMAPDYLKKVPLQGGAPGTTGDPVKDAALFQWQHNNYVFLSNMSLMRHTATMNALNNIGGYHPYTYTYH